MSLESSMSRITAAFVLACCACLCDGQRQAPGSLSRTQQLDALLMELLAQSPAVGLSTPRVPLRASSAQLKSRTHESKRYKELVAKHDKEVPLDIGEAVERMKELATAKFTETAELHANLNLNPKFNDQQIRTTVSLPHGTGKSVRVAVLATGPAADDATAAGADVVGMEDLIEDISQGILNFDVLLATPPAMPKLAKLGRVLGPKGLMPSPKAGTVTATPAEAVKEFKAGKLEFRTDKEGMLHVPFGKMDFESQQLQENLVALLETIGKARPSGAKGKMWHRLTIASTMGPGIQLKLKETLDQASIPA